ncbi:aminoglycoside phosphotransferase family protein [Streptomyces sp. H10-C2]|uniref:phosphotransferase family protein n=1 Tax=unclassified Streptomyces TaxID=2593676 RepID=UPI0024BAD7F9|nr:MULTISPECIES: aminoglycoside phosphotransferase family protein [unclassified Streptomyces]MDJ0346834.1 aminoglycoside phosphotransferase family protein [Streptomyces sp. PH10-H1]MDJ0375736.1 aminoglycoside phosphotransferase family protein [Streptomyces sp. H10-C2]
MSPESAARTACRESGLSDRSLTQLHLHATSVYLLPAEDIVVRVSSADQTPRLSSAVALTRWLVSNRYPATEPVDLPQPMVCGPYAVTFWVHYPQQEHSASLAGHLGDLLRRLHDLPPPPVALPEYQPMSSLKTTVASSIGLGHDQRDWLMARMHELLDEYRQLDFPLGHGLLHGDAYPGNALWDGSRPRLGDWDEAAVGPREIDLANTFQGVRFGRTDAELDDFGQRYGYDIRQWPGLPILCRIRDLHTLGSYIRRADKGDEAAANQLSYRIETLRNEDDEAQWEAA